MMMGRMCRPTGGCDFAVDPELRADQTSPIWLPHLDPATVLLTKSPDEFSSHDVAGLTPTLVRRAHEGEYRIVRSGQGRHQFVLTADLTTSTPAAAVIPLDENFAARANAALRLWRSITRQQPGNSRDSQSAQRRQRLALALRALDGHLASASYRVIAQVLFGAARVPAGSNWKTHDLRDRTIRLVRTGTKLMQGGYLDLLRQTNGNR